MAVTLTKAERERIELICDSAVLRMEIEKIIEARLHDALAEFRTLAKDNWQLFCDLKADDHASPEDCDHCLVSPEDILGLVEGAE